MNNTRGYDFLLSNSRISKYFIRLLLFKIITASLMFSIRATKDNSYHSLLIKEIYEKRGTCGILISSAEHHQSFKDLRRWHGLIKTLSDDGIPTLMITFGQFEERFEYYTKNAVRPLVVIIFASVEEVYSFSKIAMHLDMTYAVWIFLFVDEASVGNCEFCRSPHGNLLNLRYNTEAVVSCCGTNMIDEWWSVVKGHTTSLELGQWNDQSQDIEWFFDDALYNRRHSIGGQEFRIGGVKKSIYFWEENGVFYGYLGEFLKELSLSLNFTPKVIWQEDYGTRSDETSGWTGVVGLLERREADLVICELRMTNERFYVVDYTIPIEIGGTRLYLRKLDAARLHWNAYFKAFAVDVWVVIISLIISVPILLTLIQYRRHSYFVPLTFEHYSCIWGIYCQQGVAVSPKRTSLRIVYLSVFVSALVCSGAYSASLISFLAVSSTYSPFNTMEEFVNDGSYQLIVLKGSPDYDMFKTSNLTLVKKMMSLMKPIDLLPQSFQEAFNQVCTEQVVFYTHEAIKKAMANRIDCEITSVYSGTTENLALALPRNSDYRQLVNSQIRRFGDNGMLQRLSNKYFTEYYRKELNHPSVHLQGILPIITILAAGFVIASITFIIERITCSSRNNSLNLSRRISF